MLSNAYFLGKFRFDTAENGPAKKLQILQKKFQALVMAQAPGGLPGRRPSASPPDAAPKAAPKAAPAMPSPMANLERFEF